MLVTSKLLASITIHQSSLAIPRSLQHRIKALLLQPSVAVGMPEGSKYSCSPRAMPTSLTVYMSISIEGIEMVKQYTFPDRRVHIHD